MTATEIIEEIKHLPAEEQARVEDYFSEQREARQLSGDELGKLAEKMISTEDPAEKAVLREEITRGFYGN